MNQQARDDGMRAAEARFPDDYMPQRAMVLAFRDVFYEGYLKALRDTERD